MSGREKGSFYQQQKRLLGWGVETETRGVDVALERVDEIEELIDEQLGGLRESIDGWTGKDSVKEINSPAKKAEALFAPPPRGMGLEPPRRPNGRVYKTAITEQISTAKEHLQTVAYQHPVIPAFIEQASLSTIKSNFIKGLNVSPNSELSANGKYVHPVTGDSMRT